jgi:hypothetical protein
MPPRPIVQLSFEETYSHFKRLSIDGMEVTDVLKYTNPQSLLVRPPTVCATKRPPLMSNRTLSCVFRQRSLSRSSISGPYSRHTSSRTW